MGLSDSRWELVASYQIVASHGTCLQATLPCTLTRSRCTNSSTSRTLVLVRLRVFEAWKAVVTYPLSSHHHCAKVSFFFQPTILHAPHASIARLSASIHLRRLSPGGSDRCRKNLLITQYFYSSSLSPYLKHGVIIPDSGSHLFRYFPAKPTIKTIGQLQTIHHGARRSGLRCGLRRYWSWLRSRKPRDRWCNPRETGSRPLRAGMFPISCHQIDTLNAPMSRMQGKNV